MRKVMQIGIILFLGAANPAMANTWEMWKSCPKDSAAYTELLKKFDREAESKFSGRNEQELAQIYLRNNRESALLRFICPYMLPATIAAEVDKSCWAFYQDFKEGMDSADLAEADSSLSNWRACLTTKYKAIPGPLKPLLTCFEKIGPKK